MSNNSPKDVKLDIRKFLSKFSQQLQNISNKLEQYVTINQDLKTIKDDIGKLKQDVDIEMQNLKPKGTRSGRDK